MFGPMRAAIRIRFAIAVVGLLALGALLLVPGGLHAARLVAAQDDPARLADLQLEGRFDEVVARREIEAGLAAGDAELAESVLALARERAVPVEKALAARIEAAAAQSNSMLGIAGRFAGGFVFGDTEGLAGLAGTVTSDLLVVGDVRDVATQTTRLARGENVDELILGLASVGLAVTAGTYATLGTAGPVRVGVSLAKAAAKTGRLGTRLAESLVRPLRGAVDTGALKAAVAGAGAADAVAVARGIRAAVKLERAGGLVDTLGDIGRIQAKAGTRAALDGMRVAESPRDVARLAGLAVAKGGKTRAMLKVLGRGAIALTVGLLELAGWLFWAVFNVLALVLALKRFTERATLAVIRRGKRRRAAALARVVAPRAEAPSPNPEPAFAHAVVSLR